jgi:hypothetical protein
MLLLLLLLLLLSAADLAWLACWQWEVFHQLQHLRTTILPDHNSQHDASSNCNSGGAPAWHAGHTVAGGQ